MQPRGRGRRWCGSPVRVATGRAGNIIRVVTDAEQAARMLLAEEWPADKATRRQVAARKAVIAALEHAMDPLRAERARKAFERAADEAGVLMPQPPVSVAAARTISRGWRKR